MNHTVIQAEAGEFAIENLIRSTYESIQRIKAERRKKTEMVQSTLLNDAQYRLVNEQHKELGRKKLIEKSRVFSNETTKKLIAETKDMAKELKERKSAMSAYIEEYKKKTGSSSIEMLDGREFVFTVSYQLALFSGMKPIKKSRKG